MGHDAEPHDATIVVLIPVRVVPARADDASVVDAIEEMRARFDGALLARGVSVGTITASVVPARADQLGAAVSKARELL